MGEIWYPPKKLVDNSNVTKFMEKHEIKDYKELVKRSCEDIEWFWSVVVEELQVKWFKQYTKVMDTSKGIMWTRWFIDGRLNITYNALDAHAHSGKRNKVAFVWVGENGQIKEYTYHDLYIEVNKFANALKSLGIRKGDTVALYMPMLPETVISFYAILKIGAIVVPIFSGFSPSAVATRIKDAGSKVLITTDGTYRKGKVIKLKSNADESIKEADTVKNVIVCRRTGIDVPWINGRDAWWDELCQNQPKECSTKEVESEHPALLMYTSGTTGKPKGAVLSHVGSLLQPSKEIYFNLDLKREDVLFWITDIGWMMGPWQLIGVQHHGGTHLIFEGAPDYPKPDRVWSIVEDSRISILGGAATVFRLLKGYGDKWVKKHDLDSLRMLANTGEPLDPDTWRWLHRIIGRKECPIINLSGGTELIGCFLLPLPIMPLKPSTLGGPGLGMDIDVYNDAGNPVRGEIGYLVCKKPAPSMTKGFWKNPQRYLETYWSRWPNVWYHGDWASIDEDGFWFLHGRADDVIKVAGKRVGPAEIEFILNQHPAARESACIGMTHELKGETLVGFITLNSGYQPGPKLEDELKNLVVKYLGKPFKPTNIIFIKDLPKNRAGKIMRRMIKAVSHMRDPGDLSVVENPEVLKEIKIKIGNINH